MLLSKNKYRPSLSFKARHLIRSVKKLSVAKMKIKSIPLVDLPVIDVAASGCSILGTDRSSLASQIVGSVHVESWFWLLTNLFLFLPQGPLSVLVWLCWRFCPSICQSNSPPMSEIHFLRGGLGSFQFSSVLVDVVVPQVKNYAALLKSPAQLQELGTPVEHVSGAPFVLILDEKIETAKLEFNDFICARFHGDYSSMGKIISIVNAVWERMGSGI